MKQEFASLYDTMANQKDVKYMQIFGGVHKEMFDWFVQNKPDLAQEWLDKLEAIKCATSGRVRWKVLACH